MELLAENSDFNIAVVALKDGSQKVFEEIYAQYYKRLCVFLMGYCDDKEVVEDVVQDVFVKLWLNRSALDIKTSLAGYLFKMAYNLLMDNYREFKKQNKFLDSYYYTVMTLSIDSDAKSDLERLNKLEQCIEKLPPKCKEVFFENKMKGLKYQEVAEKLNLSIKTVEGHVSRALIYLRNCFKEG